VGARVSRGVIIRDLTPGDLEPMRAIYAHHVRQGLGTFEETPPEPDDFAGRAAAVQALGLPWLAAEADGRLLGYGYASPFRPRSGYRFTVEDSVYVAPEHAGRGVGRALLAAVIDRCTAAGSRLMYAYIGDSDNAASIGLHRALGFELSGVMRPAGFKHGRWIDVVIMQKHLGDGATSAPQGHGWMRAE
jgi:L-amino acid N-acyltransferase YncA